MNERWTVLMEAVGEHKRVWWVVLIRLLLLFALLFAGAWGLMWILGIPQQVGLFFAAVLGVQGCGLAWVTAGIRAKVRQGLVEVRYESHLLRKRGLQILAAFALLFVMYALFIPNRIWFQTTSVIVLSLLGLYGGFSLLSSYLIEWEGRVLSHGFAGRWIGRMTAFLVASTGFVLLILFNFLGGIHWWYNAYVTPDKRKQVAQRKKYLKELKLTTLFDRHNRYMGLYKKTESDWSSHYNDPEMMKWKVSRAISVAEGAVQKPAWWWRYLPDGERLQCEPFSIEAFLRVPYYMLKQRRKVGGSTPALQAAKNFLDFGGGRQGKGLLVTVRTKLFSEMPRSYIMCQAFSPRDMMAVYQATLWAGKGANYGVHRMALYFFGIDDPTQLDWNQSSVIAASLPNAGRLNPWYTQSCREGKCSSKRRKAVYKVWVKRIRAIKARLRSQGHKVPKELPAFRDGLDKLNAISYGWKNHDLHIRSWLKKMIQQRAPLVKDWNAGARIRLFYDRKMTVGTDKEKGLARIALSSIKDFREQLDTLQASFTLVNSKNGRIVSQFGGDGHVDMALAKKPVVGSTFKVLTLMVGDQWPDALPFVNKGRTRSLRRRFVYHPTPRHPSHWVRNSHSMPPYVHKTDALAISANIGFVYFSLRWTWMASPLVWLKTLSIGLQQMFQEREKMTSEQAKRAAEVLMKHPVHLRRKLVSRYGFRLYFQQLRERSIFEAAKAATVKALLSDPEIDKKKLADLLDMEIAEPMDTLDQKIQDTFKAEKEAVTKRFQGALSLEELSWNRELRMEMGLRYIIHLAKHVAGYDPKKSHLVPVMTMTLGVNDADTRQLASVASTVASKTIRPPRMLMTISRRKRTYYEGITRSLSRPLVAMAALEGARKAMQAVLEKGTAASSGRMLSRRFGASILSQAGAKTGTVQGSRGVSCIGYLEHRAGAVTLSTPRNEVLRAYRIRTYMTRRRDRYKRLEKRWYKRFERTRSQRRKRRYMKLALKYKRLFDKEDQKIKKERAFGKRYYKARIQQKTFAKLARRYAIRARKMRYRTRRYMRRMRTYTRYIRTQKRRLQREQKRIQRLGDVQNLSARNRRRYAYYSRRARTYQKKALYWQRQMEKVKKQLDQAHAWIRKASTQANVWHQKAQTVRSQYAGMSRRFRKYHQPWSLSSTKACLLLFKLLSHWKEWEAKIEAQPKPEPVPSLASAKDIQQAQSAQAANATNPRTGQEPFVPDGGENALVPPQNSLAEQSIQDGGTSEPIPERMVQPEGPAQEKQWAVHNKGNPDTRPKNQLNRVLDALKPKKTILHPTLLRPVAPRKRTIFMQPPPRIVGEKKKP